MGIRDSFGTVEPRYKIRYLHSPSMGRSLEKKGKLFKQSLTYAAA